MFERFTDQARHAVVLAQEAATELNHNFIGTEHLLLGLLRAEKGSASHVLTSLGVVADRVRERVAELVAAGDEPVSGRAPFTPRGKKVLELALRESLSLSHDYIGTEHILLGLARENEGVGARILLEQGIDGEAVRAGVLAVIPVGAIRSSPRTSITGRTGRPRISYGGWLDEGVALLLERLAGDIRRELRREPDSGDLLMVLACSQRLLAGRAVAALPVDLDALSGKIEQFRAEGTRTQQESEATLEVIRRRLGIAQSADEPPAT
jgi:hypothetical protein